MMGFNDAFWALAWVTAGLGPLTFLLRRPKKGEGVNVPHQAEGR
jgi:hypothetical protein